MDGKLMLVTNVSDMSAAEVVKRYKALADIERGFRVLKSEIEIAPGLPPPARAHQGARQHLLHGADPVPRHASAPEARRHRLSPEAALEDLRRIQRHTVSIDSAAPIHGVSTVQPRQAQALAALKHQEARARPQLSLL
jgi:hypothetical protein